MIFSYQDYTRFLQHLQSAAPVMRLCDWSAGRAILLRHDVDLSVTAARRLAEVEAAAGVRSSYFFLTTSDVYNTTCSENRQAIRELAELGFEVGLHFDPTIYGDLEADALLGHVKAECALLESITQEPVRSVSLHNPSIHGRFPLFEGYVNAYDPVIFEDSRYLADSRMHFRGKSPYEFVDQTGDQPLQVLLHPFHFTEQGHGYEEIFTQHVVSLTSMIDSSFRPNAAFAAAFPQGLPSRLGLA